MNEGNRRDVLKMRRNVLKDAVLLGRYSDAFWAELADLVAKYSGDLVRLIEAQAERQLEDPDSNRVSAESGPEQCESQNRYCSFCGKGEPFVGKLIAGPGVFICNGCVDFCVEDFRGKA